MYIILLCILYNIIHVLEFIVAFVRKSYACQRAWLSVTFRETNNKEGLKPYKYYFSVNRGEGNVYRNSPKPVKISALYREVILLKTDFHIVDFLCM